VVVEDMLRYKEVEGLAQSEKLKDQEALIRAIYDRRAQVWTTVSQASIGGFFVLAVSFVGTVLTGLRGPSPLGAAWGGTVVGTGALTLICLLGALVSIQKAFNFHNELIETIALYAKIKAQA
jgi:hypothetical protein